MNSFCQSTTRVWEVASVLINRKPHTLESKKITEARNPKWSSKFVRGHGVLHSMLRNLMSLFIKIISLYSPIYFLLFCTQHHQRTWRLRWERGMVTRSYSIMPQSIIPPFRWLRALLTHWIYCSLARSHRFVYCGTVYPEVSVPGKRVTDTIK